MFSSFSSFDNVEFVYLSQVANDKFYIVNSYQIDSLKQDISYDHLLVMLQMAGFIDLLWR